jgi:NhaP-type Na+/H+ or K+/H+ antiporter
VHNIDYALMTIAWAAVIGMLAQVIGNRMRIPAIVPLLAVGLALGPSGLGLVRPSALGDGLSVIVKLAVAVIQSATSRPQSARCETSSRSECS